LLRKAITGRLKQGSIRAKAAAGGEDVDVGVVLLLARPGVQDGGEAGNCA